MDCPLCKKHLATIQYEGIQIETCAGCGGEWLDGDELLKVTKIREVKFDAEVRRAIAEATPALSFKLENHDRTLRCPSCTQQMEPRNYGGNTGLIIDRCENCGGIWLDDSELEHVQALVEGWEDLLPDDLKEHSDTLRDTVVDVKEAGDVGVSKIPIIGPFINAMVNGILDLSHTTR